MELKARNAQAELVAESNNGIGGGISSFPCTSATEHAVKLHCRLPSLFFFILISRRLVLLSFLPDYFPFVHCIFSSHVFLSLIDHTQRRKISWNFKKCELQNPLSKSRIFVADAGPEDSMKFHLASLITRHLIDSDPLFKECFTLTPPAFEEVYLQVGHRLDVPGKNFHPHPIAKKEKLLCIRVLNQN